MSKRREQTPPRIPTEKASQSPDAPLSQSQKEARHLLEISEDHARQVEPQLQPLPKKVKKTLETDALAAAGRGAAAADPFSLAAQLPPLQQPPPQKRVKKAAENPLPEGTGEVVGAPTPARSAAQAVATPPTRVEKRPRRAASPAPTSQPAPSGQRAPPAQPAQPAQPAPSAQGAPAPRRLNLDSPAPTAERNVRRREREGQERGGGSGSVVTGMAWVMSEVRSHLETMVEVEGVRQQLEDFPECVLLGGIAARRQLVASLLGDTAPAQSAAAALVAPGLRQPLALELRSNANGVAALDLASMQGPELDAWLARVSSAASAALGQRLKVDPLRLRLSTVGCASLDVVDLPESQGVAPVPPKVDEMRVRHMGSASNLLVCLEAGPHVDLARRFDPALQRTVLLGAAAEAGGAHGLATALPPSMLRGPAAAQALEDRFAKMCHERLAKWIAGVERIELRLTKSLKESQEQARGQGAHELLSRARAAGLGFGSALQQVVGGTPCCTTSALTLEEELMEFAAAVSSSTCGIGPCLTGKEAAAAAEELFSSFNGIEGYIAYLRENVGVGSADVPLNGGAAWHRLMEEIEIAMRLVHPSAKDYEELAIGAVQAGGTGAWGHQRWDDVAAKLLIELAYEPLRRRIRYVVARVAWALQEQKSNVVEWMAAVSDGPSSRMYSPLFGQHLDVVRSSAIARDLVFSAFNKAATNVATLLLKNLEGTLNAMCLNPRIMCRPSTQPDSAGDKVKPRQPCDVRNRVKAEMKLRSGSSGGSLPSSLCDRTFEPREAMQQMPRVQRDLSRAFRMLANVLANQTFAFADTSLTALCRRHLDEAMSAMSLNPEQQRALDAREGELQALATQATERLDKVRRCIISLKSARSSSLVR